MLVGSKISCFISYKHVIGSSWALSGVMVSLILLIVVSLIALKSLLISTQSALWV